MYPVVPMEMNHLVAESLLFFLTAASAVLSVIFCSR
jgi:hypothetical protein